MTADPQHTAYAGVLYAIVGVAATATITWLVNSVGGYPKRILTLENVANDGTVKLAEMCKDIEGLKEARTTHDIKVGRLESAIEDIRKAVDRCENQFTVIVTKLEQLPRVTTMLEQYSNAIGVIVPRTEVDARLKHAEERLHLVEQDIRIGALNAGGRK